MSDPVPNTALMDAIEAQIDAHPDTWNQDDWRTAIDCGTAYCYAGWACALNGAEWRYPLRSLCSGSLVPLEGEDLELASVSTRATSLLGLTHEEADDLFDSHNSREDIALISKRIRQRAAEQAAS